MFRPSTVDTHASVVVLSTAVAVVALLVVFRYSSPLRRIDEGAVFGAGNPIELPLTPIHRQMATLNLEANQGSGGDPPMSIDPKAFSEVGFTTYTVREGDTIWEIATERGLWAGTIMSVNPINDVRRLLPGTELTIPDRDGLMHSVQEGQTISDIASHYEVKATTILDANDLSSDLLDVGATLFIPGATMDEEEYLLATGELFQWPLTVVRTTSSFGMRRDPFTGAWRMHTGLDLGNPWGAPVLAAAAGTVVVADPSSDAYGKLVVLDHGNGRRSYYAHMSKILVRPGERVRRAEPVGNVGSTGRSTGPHLHFSVSRFGRWEDPLRYLP